MNPKRMMQSDSLRLSFQKLQFLWPSTYINDIGSSNRNSFNNNCKKAKSGAKADIENGIP